MKGAAIKDIQPPERHRLGSLIYKNLLAVAAGCMVLLVCTNLYISYKTGAHLTNKITELPKTRVALVLGTSERRAGGGVNLYFTYRMQAAAQLYKSGKVRILIVSGDNRSRYYNEPAMMRRALMALGVPGSAIWLDYAGLRTLDSVRRVKRIFGQDSLIIVSQRFHNERAVFLARQIGLVAFGYNAQDVGGWEGFRTHLREVFAKMLALWDLAGIRREGF